MKAPLKNKVCENGHTFQKSSDCPVCPICEKEKIRNDELPIISAPAIRALERIGVNKLDQLKDVTEKDLSELHGMGPKAISILRNALELKGLSFLVTHDKKV